MPEWTPPISTLSKERHAILQLIKLCQRYQARSTAATTSLQLLAPNNLHFAAKVLALQQELLVSSEQEADTEYREVEHALLEGTDYLPALQELLDRHRPKNP